jgi:hypothetical protein
MPEADDPLPPVLPRERILDLYQMNERRWRLWQVTELTVGGPACLEGLLPFVLPRLTCHDQIISS